LKTLIKIIQQAQITMEIKKKKRIEDIIKRQRRIERIVCLIGLTIGVIIGIKILIGMVTLIN
jgi:hypothetical protein